MTEFKIEQIYQTSKGTFVEFSPACTLNRIINCYTLEELNTLIKELDILISCNDTEPVIGEFSFIEFPYGANEPKVYLNLYDPSDIWRADIEKKETTCYYYSYEGEDVIENVFKTEEVVKALKEWHKTLNLEVKVYSKIRSKISALRDLSTRRPLLTREKIELDFLAKIQAADTLEALQSIENEVNSTPTDPELIKQLLHYVNEKKGFY